MHKINGKSVYDGIAVGKAFLLKRTETLVQRINITDINQEFKRLEEAKNKAITVLKEIYLKAVKDIGEDNAQIFDIHMMMLQDEDYNESIRSIIELQKVNAEYAVAVTSENFSEMFSSMDDIYMQARAADVKDISERLIRILSGTDERENKTDEKIIICADDLAPSETVLLDKEKVLAFVTAYGSINSHTAILARNMNIPAIIGIGESALEKIKLGMLIAVDGFTGEIILEPDNTMLNIIMKKQKDEEYKKKLLLKLKGKDNITKSGKKINVYANIGSVDNIGEVILNDAGGIGLFRSEFIYLESRDFPTEEYQFRIYKRVLESMGSKKVVIRTLDAGADKQISYLNINKEENPALGFRAIRICLTHPEIFTVQLRALYRASVYGNLAIMFPMITSEEEVQEILCICKDVREQLKKEGIPFSEKTELGIMIETPAAAIISDKLAPLVDFFSIGTNDLTQYTLACDRQNPLIERFVNTHHEAIMRLIKTSCDNIHKENGWIGICGELAADLKLTDKFIEMGIDELSVSPSTVLKLREKIRSL